MAINRNLNWEIQGEGRADDGTGANAMTALLKTTRIKKTLGGGETLAETPAKSKFNPDTLAEENNQPFSEAVKDFIDQRQVIPSHTNIFLPRSKTTTQIAQGALNYLRGAPPASVGEAVTTVKNKQVPADGLMNYLEYKTRVGEVLNELAKDWSEQTRQSFAEAFQMNVGKLDVMDAIVSLAVLNDPELPDELMAENTTDATQGDLMENRRISWQWPPAGTQFNPPYLIIVAVERQDSRQAESVIQSVLGDLVDYQAYKIPSSVAKKLRLNFSINQADTLTSSTL